MPITRYSDKPEFKSIDDLVNQWLKAREELLISYYKAANIYLFEEDLSQNQLEYFKIFLNNLIDYTSVGHFEIFQKMIDISVAGNDLERIKVDESLILELLYSTSFLLDFYKKYQSTNNLEKLAKIANEISKVGEELTDRFDLEDSLIESYINASSKLKSMIPPKKSDRTA